MSSEMLVVVVSGIIALISGVLVNWLNIIPKKEEASMSRINLIIVEYEKSLERCNDRNKVLVRENRELRAKLKGDDKEWQKFQQ